MKVVALAALSVFVMLPAEAGQRHRTNVSPEVICDNDGHCTTLASSASVSPLRNRPKIKSTLASAAPAPAPAPAAAAAAPAAAAAAPAAAPAALPTAATSAAATGTAASAPATDEPATAITTATASATTAETAPAAFPTSDIVIPAPVPLPKPRAAALEANGKPVGIIVSSKTGARARVGVAYAARFQAYIDDLEKNHGAKVLFMGGIRPGPCSVASEHPCGKALDLCQLRRGVVDARCNLPGRVALGQIAAAHGLFEGGRWCDSDYGHAQIGVTAPACGGRWPVRLVQR